MAVIEIGQLKKIVVFKKNTPIAKGAGKKDVYATLLTTRGYLERSSGSRTLEAGQEISSNRWTLVTRFQNALLTEIDVNRSNMKVEIDSKTFLINGTPELIDERRMYYRFSLTQQQ